jgi:MarR family 2-MHQ and catechol resistance regulon transcriptional repressor
MHSAPANATVTDDLSPDASSALHLWVILARAHAAIAAHASEDAARHGLTLAEFGILEALYHRGPLLLGEVQRRILVSSGGITFLVDRLTDKGLVERRFCPSDRRARYAALTPRGQELVAEIFPEHAKLLAKVMGGLSVPEQQMTAELLRTLGLQAAGTPRAADQLKHAVHG